MKSYSGMPANEFISALRDAAIKSNAAPAVIWQIDSLADVDSLEADLEKVGGELTDMESDRDDLREELKDLVTAVLDATNEMPRHLHSALLMALSAVERHGDEASAASLKKALEKRA